MAPTAARAVDRVVLQNRDDPRREFREIVLYPYGGSLFTVWESVGFSSDSNAEKTEYQLQIGSRSEMQLFVKSEVERLCDEEGFTIVK